ncbi:hypothetical protein MNBD_GAMMA21-992 [hydrothermal vent metagenome]|uniref:Cyclic nucleotide-binding domain-containing protein n=1 Tax=hydrothermal vent metagenome TaxID=652676 RepID=A0A3B1A440_9ZZZZ
MSKNLAVTMKRLKDLEPLSNLSAERLEELVSLSYIEKLPVGVNIFHEGDIDNQTIYLLEGDVQLSTADGKTDSVITSRQEESKHPLDDSQPRQVCCTALSRVELVRIDNSVLDYMMMWDQLAVSEEVEAERQIEKKSAEQAKAKQDPESSQAKSVKKKSEPAGKSKATQQEVKTNQATPQPQESPAVDSEDKSPAGQKAGASDVQVETETKQGNTRQDSDDEPKIPAFVGDEDKSWIRKMRHIMAFKNMPPANIKALLENMETIIVEDGEVVVQQGAEGDYYYVLTEGEAKVTRTVELATLTAGASFGEEALVSEGQRNASVTMKGNGMLMRLSKKKFNALLKEPMLARVSPDDARVNANKGAIWLDVRHAKEYSFSRLPKAINIPLHEMRIRISELDKKKQYICYCSTGRRSSAAAFLLVQRGYNACVLNGGIKVMAQDLIK